MSSTKEKKGEGLRKGRLGVAAIVFFVVAASAPMAGMTGVVPVAAVLGTGAAVPGAYVLVGAILLLFSVGFTAMSHKVTNAGAFFAYVGKGLGINLGVGAAFSSILAYLTVQLAVFGFFGAIANGFFTPLIGVDLGWLGWCFISWAAVTVLSLLTVDVGAKFLGVLTALELLSLLIAGVAILAKVGPEGVNFQASFDPSLVLAGGFVGTAGIALSFAFASFIGFESTAIYGEEAKNPKSTVRRATYVAVSVIAGLFALVSFAMVTAVGSSKFVEETLARSEGLVNPAGVLFSLTSEAVGPWLADTMAVLLISSMFAGLLAFQNAASRYFFAMARGGVLPRAIASVNGRGAPAGGVYATSAITLIVMVLFFVNNLDPVLNLFYWLSTVAVVAITLVEILVSLAVIAYFRKNGGANVWQSVIAPALATLGMALAMYLIIARFNLLSGTVADGVDPTLPESGFALSPLGWFLVALPFIFFVGGLISAIINTKENSSLVDDMS